MQMNLAGNRLPGLPEDGVNAHVNVVYKREDGNYGLIETGPETTPS